MLILIGSIKSDSLWLSSLGLYQHDKDVLCSQQWLNDGIIHAAQTILKRENNNFHGLQSPQCGRALTFKALSREKYVQVLHVSNSHWITVSNVNILNAPEFDSVFVYDSMLPTKVDMNIKKQVCSLAKHSCSTLNFNIVNVMAQTNSYDCGLFALANITEIIYGHDPAKCLWDTAKMRYHLKSCLESGHMERFPTTRQRRIPFGRRIKHYNKENIYCVCRMPYDELPMIECCSCRTWFHGKCLNLDITKYEDKNWKCDECEQLYS